MVKVRRILENETGSALLITLGAIVILTILSIGMLSLAENDITLSRRERKSTQALHVAEAGIDKALWQLKRLGTINQNSFQVETSLGAATVTASKDAGEQYLWTITSTGEVSGGIRRVIKVEVFNLSYWNMAMATESLTASGGGVNGTTSVDGPFYVRGNLELSGNSQITGGPVFIKEGKLILSSNGCSVGTADNPIVLYLEQGYEKKNQNAELYYKSLSYSVPNINLPALGASELEDLESSDDPNKHSAKYQSTDLKQGDNGPSDSDEATAPSRKYSGARSGYYKIIDDNLTPATIGNGTCTLEITASTSSFGVRANSQTDDFALDTSTSPPTLIVRGTVFVDGPVTISTDIRYQGNGCIVANGDITIQNDIVAADAFPSSSCLGFVSSKSIYIDNPSSNSSLTPNIEAAFYALESVKVQATVCIQGAILSRDLEFEHPNGHLLSALDLPGNLPDAMPRSTECYTIVSSWHEGKP